MKKNILSILLCLLYVVFAYPQTTESIRFVNINLNDGLSQSTILDITQDDKGNMWFATHSGLNKYNGYEFTIYQHDEQNPHSIADDLVRTCYKDKFGNIWVGTAQGLSLYDADKDHFENFTLSSDKKNANDIRGIADFDNDKLLIYINKELKLFSHKERKFMEGRMPEGLSNISPTTINRQDDDIFIGSKNGLFKYSISRQEFKEFTIPSLKNKNIQTVLRQSATKIWVGTEGNGLFMINPESGQSVQYKHIHGEKGSISSNYVRSLAFDSKGQLWVGTMNGLNIYDHKSNSFRTYGDENSSNEQVPYISVRSIFKDSQDGMWVGTYFDGANYYHPLKNRFHNLQLPGEKGMRNRNVIGCIQEDADGNLWIGTNGNGINFYNPHSGKVINYNKSDGLGSNDIKAIYIDDKNNLTYVGGHTGGLNIIHKQSGKTEIVESTRNKNIYAIEPDEKGNLWISFLFKICYYDRSSNTVNDIGYDSSALSSGITMIYRDKKKRLWIGGKNGIDTFNDNEGKLTHLQIFDADAPFRNKYVNCIYESNDGHFWIATRYGLYKFNEKTKKTIHYTTSQGLPSNVVHGILEDDHGKLWISTDNGLSYLQPQTEKFRNYTIIDGLQSNQFTDNAFYRTSDGRMYFGGINGITYFHPTQLVDNPYIPPVIINQLNLFNKTVRPGDNTGILEKDISNTQCITLTAKQKMFSLQFVVPNYISGKHNTFAYTLKGYDDEWYHTTHRTVSYSNLPQGTYHFLVKAANNDGKWNENPTELKIIILPVWYKTWWALLIFIIIGIAIVITISRFFWTRKMMAAQIEFERKDKERQKEVNEMKLRFFINMAHELRTPLTLILAPVQEMKTRISDKWMQKQLEYVWQNTSRLLHLVNQLMDYRKAELGMFVLKAYPNNVHHIVEKIFLSYKQAAQRKNIRYKLLSEVEEKNILCDPYYIELIANNLLSNAFKHTAEGQSITVLLKKTDNNLLLQVKDTGDGIPKEKQDRIFERFYQVDNSNSGSGIGLSLVKQLVELHHGRIELLSEKGKGSTFSVYLPDTTDTYRQEELANDELQQQEIKQSDKFSDSTYIDDSYSHVDNNSDEEGDDDAKEYRAKGYILIVEDNQDILHYLKDGLKQTYNIIEANNGAEAIEIIDSQEIDLIITDVMMPVMDGLQLCKYVKQNVQTSHIPVIILSAKGELNEQMDGLRVGADDYIPKPFSLCVVKMKIQNQFRTRHRIIKHYSQSLEIEPEGMSLNPVDEEFLRKAKEVIERHIDDQEFSTETFAQEMLMSRSGLHLKMKALTGESTYEFIRKIRFNKACKLLREGGYTIAEISNMTGFNTPSYFSTSFKKYFGYMPTEYAKNNGAKQN